MMLEKPAGKPNARCTCLTTLRMVSDERPNCKRNFFKQWFSLNLHRCRHLLFPLHRYTHLLFALHRYRHLLFDIASRSMPSKIFPFLFLLKKFQNNFIAALAFGNLKLNQVVFRNEASLQYLKY